ncbi:MAG TPA: MBL fold metallo-hydrolase [Anaeromyxobacteraceae bacterium]|nr:MBL fold metallo-hydrolase [Anaeromyxobacteraceae bacterium]
MNLRTLMALGYNRLAERLRLPASPVIGLLARRRPLRPHPGGAAAVKPPGTAPRGLGRARDAAAPGRTGRYRSPVLALLLALAVTAPPPGRSQPIREDGRFRNPDGAEPRGFGDLLKWRLNRTSTPDRAPVPRMEPDLARLARPPAPGEGARLTWLGHSSFLVQLDGVSLLLDPALSEGIGPGGIVGRNVPPGIPVEALPRVDACLVSHDHYDHLDLPTLQKVRCQVVAGLGREDLFRKARLLHVPLGWWQSTAVGGVTVTFVPAQHFSQRSLSDRGRGLWGGFVVQGGSATLYHAGDTGYFAGFAEIGRAFPGIDAAMLPIGAYEPRWFMKGMHVDPDEALQALQDLGARTFVAMHWGTFKQADEALDEPPRRLEAERSRRGIAPERVRVLAIGETLEVRRPPAERGARAGRQVAAPP